MIELRSSAERSRPFIFAEMLSGKLTTLQLGHGCLDPEHHAAVRDTLSEVLTEVWAGQLASAWREFRALLPPDPDPLVARISALVERSGMPNEVAPAMGAFDAASASDPTGRVVAHVGPDWVRVEFDPSLLYATERDVTASIKEAVNLALVARIGSLSSRIEGVRPEDIDLSVHEDAIVRLERGYL